MNISKDENGNFILSKDSKIICVLKDSEARAIYDFVGDSIAEENLVYKLEEEYGEDYPDIDWNEFPYMPNLVASYNKGMEQDEQWVYASENAIESYSNQIEKWIEEQSKEDREVE